MLLVGAGLLIKSFARLQDVEPGILVGTSPDGADLAAGEPLRGRGGAARVLGAAARQGAGRSRGRGRGGLTSNVPFNGNVSSGSYSIVGYTPGPSEAQPHGRQEVVGGDYFRAMQIPVLAGPGLHRRRHGRQPAGRRDRPVPGEPVFRRTAARSARKSSAARGRRAASPSSASSARSTASTSRSRSRRSGSTIRSRNSRGRAWRWC